MNFFEFHIKNLLEVMNKNDFNFKSKTTYISTCSEIDPRYYKNDLFLLHSLMALTDEDLNVLERLRTSGVMSGLEISNRIARMVSDVIIINNSEYYGLNLFGNLVLQLKKEIETCYPQQEDNSVCIHPSSFLKGNAKILLEVLPSTNLKYPTIQEINKRIASQFFPNSFNSDDVQDITVDVMETHEEDLRYQGAEKGEE